MDARTPWEQMWEHVREAAQWHGAAYVRLVLNLPTRTLRFRADFLSPEESLALDLAAMTAPLSIGGTNVGTLEFAFPRTAGVPAMDWLHLAPLASLLDEEITRLEQAA